jgi:hypothetical protein
MHLCHDQQTTTRLRSAAALALAELQRANSAFAHLNSGFETKLLMEVDTGRWIVPFALVHQRALSTVSARQ